MVAQSGQQHAASQRSGTKKRLKVLLFAMFLFLSWAGPKLWGQIGEVTAKMDRLSELESKLEETKQRNEAYKLQISRLNDPEYIEQLLRKELHMVKEGETLYIETEQPDRYR